MRGYQTDILKIRSTKIYDSFLPYHTRKQVKNTIRLAEILCSNTNLRHF
jgi:hypothetical protein